MIVSLLFWQFANTITKTHEAKRFYSHFGLLGNISLPMVAVVFYIFLSEESNFMPSNLKMMPVMIIVIIMDCIMLCIYTWIHNNVMTDPALYDGEKPQVGGADKKKKAKLSFADSFTMIFTSKYLGMICILVLAYGVSINLVEGVWKSKIKKLFPTAEGYTSFMGVFQAYQGFAAIFFMLIGSNILRRVDWSTAALLTPAMIVITGLGFFGFIVFEDSLGFIAVFIGTSPLALAVYTGLVQNVLSKATK